MARFFVMKNLWLVRPVGEKIRSNWNFQPFSLSSELRFVNQSRAVLKSILFCNWFAPSNVILSISDQIWSDAPAVDDIVTWFAAVVLQNPPSGTFYQNHHHHDWDVNIFIFIIVMGMVKMLINFTTIASSRKRWHSRQPPTHLSHSESWSLDPVEILSFLSPNLHGDVSVLYGCI